MSKEAGWRRVFVRWTNTPADDDAAARRSFFEEAGTRTPYVSVEVKELIFFVATNDRLGRGLFVRRWRQDMGHLRRAVRLLKEHGLHRPGSTFVDVGANVGTTTVPAVRWHGFGGAVVLEPASCNFRTLRLNLVANDLETRVTALQVAAVDREGEVELAISARSSGTHGLAPLRGHDRTAETRTVPAVTLDGLAARGVIDPDAAGLLWIDTAGAEALVLAGASALLERGVPIVTAVRPTLPSWPQTKEPLLRLPTGYTDFADLRHGKKPPVNALGSLLDPMTQDGDVLAFRR